MSDCDINLDDIVSGDALEKLFRNRSKKHIYKSVAKTDIQKYVDEGWEHTGPKNRKTAMLRKEKDAGLSFQDEVWCIFYRMGFTEMNGAREFAVPRYGMDIGKKIDVFAKDDHCICLVECKASGQPHTKRTLGTDIDQYGAIHQDLENSIRAYYKNKGDETKYRFRWLLILKNIDLGENDQIRAKNANILVIDDSMIIYYSDLSKQFGPASRYQFFADLYPGMTIPELIEPVPAIRGKFGDEVFYSFVIEPDKLLKIAYISHRGKTNEDSIKRYQRMASKKRLDAIARYIKERAGIFPTSIVLNIETDNKGLKFEPAKEMAGKNAVLGTLYLPNVLKTAWLIDGQHRLFAYSGLPEAKTATLPVIAFMDLDASVQQQLFIDINGEQVKVSKNLLNDLYDDLHWNSDQPKNRLLALTSKLVRNLNESNKSPLRDRIIKVGGRKTQTRNLTITTLTEEIRKSKLLGFVHSVKAKEITPGPLYQDDLDSSLKRATEVFTIYYELFLKNNTVKQQWDLGGNEGGYICTNQGIIATIRILRAILNHMEQKDQIQVRSRSIDKLQSDINKYLNPVIEYLGAASPKEIKEFRQQYAEAGVQASTFSLLKIIQNRFPEFNPPGLAEYIKKTDTTNNQEAYQYLLEIEKMIHEHVVAELKTKHGAGLKDWWFKGVKEKIRSSASDLANKSGDFSQEYDKYLYLIDWKEIIEDNWDVFSDVYTINAKHTESRARRLGWYNELNGIRNIVDHPPRGGVSNSQLEFVMNIRNELATRLAPKLNLTDI